MAENTIIIYSSDHGEMAGEKGAWQKTVFFDPSSKVPLIFRWPAKFKKGVYLQQLVGLIDLFPTICDATGSMMPAGRDGISLLPLLTDEGHIDRNEIYCESTVLKVPEFAGCMIRTDRWKYCYYLDDHNELYDMLNDPHEWNNLAGRKEFYDVEAKLKTKAVEFWEPDKQIKRYLAAPRVLREKHFYPYSNQFIISDGTIADAQP